MKTVDFSQKFKDFNGNVIPTEDTIGVMIAKCLFNGQGIPQTETDKYNAYVLCNKLSLTKKPIELSEAEEDLIKKVGAAQLTPGAYGQVVDLMNETKSK